MIWNNSSDTVWRGTNATFGNTDDLGTISVIVKLEVNFSSNSGASFTSFPSTHLATLDLLSLVVFRSACLSCSSQLLPGVTSLYITVSPPVILGCRPLPRALALLLLVEIVTLSLLVRSKASDHLWLLPHSGWAVHSKEVGMLWLCTRISSKFAQRWALISLHLNVNSKNKINCRANKIKWIQEINVFSSGPIDTQ